MRLRDDRTRTFTCEVGEHEDQNVAHDDYAMCVAQPGNPFSQVLLVGDIGGDDHPSEYSW